ncbi:protein [Lentinula edodes]|uniref:Protein n=1 Tax=Lentinula edodes TaxID=5353 RepID=A0A1Q3EP97_LENED|nr:protein [Lentinula edodes]
MALETRTISLSHLTLNQDELAFYKRQTGIHEEEKLKERIAEIAQKALDVYPYHCIWTFGFLRFRILRSQSGYKQLLELGSTRANALFLDIGCCFGNDLRKAIEDGFPAQNVIASDLRPDFWNFGHELFNTNPTTFPVTFVPGNVLESSFISTQPPLLSHESPPNFIPSVSLQSLLLLPNPKSLDPLRGHLSAIHTSAFFHLFKKDEQLLIAKKLASLLSPVPGSIIFGSHRGAATPQEGERNSTGTLFYRHSPESWKDMWEKEVFLVPGAGDNDGSGGTAEDLIRVDAGLSLDDKSREILWWTVTRL